MKFLQMKFLSYGIAGGFYYSSQFPRWMKYSWIFANFMMILVLQVFGNVGYLMTSSTKDLRDMFYAIMVANYIVLILILTTILMYYYKNEIEEVLTLNEEPFFKNIQTDSIEIEKPKGNVIQLVIFRTLFCVAYLSIPLFCFILAENPDYFNKVDYYLNANIWLGHVQKQSQYYMIFLLQLIPETLLVLIDTAIPALAFLMGQEVNTGFSKLRNFLKDISKMSSQNIEQVYQSTIDQEVLLGSQRQDIDAAVEYNTQQLTNHLETAIRVYQGLQRKMKIIKPYLEIIFSISLMGAAFNQSILIYVMCATNISDGLEQFRAVIGVIYPTFCVVIYCYTGKLLENAQEALSQQVYDIPWYYLNPRQRKTIYIFLCQTQKSVHFKAFRVYPMNMPVALQLSRMGYSTFNFLKTVLSK